MQLLRTIQVWMERRRQRRELGELADRKDQLLADIGLSVKEARREAAKPFWAFSEAHLRVRTATRTLDRKS